VRNVFDLVGVDHVGLGSEFDGATMPDGVCTARQLLALIDTQGADG
jgi:microsomal dipeptidase-like Zn-dependent dipeptidase